VLRGFKSEFTKKINKNIYQYQLKCKHFCHFIGFVCDFIDFVCELTVKATEHTVASYESSDFT
jgi:hypothetical protein